MGDAYPQRGALGHAEAQVPLPSRWVRWTDDGIPSARP
jgi:hypothetical protein